MLTRRMNSCKDKNAANMACICIAIAAIVLSACASTKIEPQSFRVSKNSRVESAQIAIDADFSRYRSLQATELGIYFPQNHPASASDQQRIRQIFRSAFLAELAAYDIVSEPGPATMAVEASLVDLRNSASTQVPQMRSDIRALATPGSILFLMEMRDSQTNKVLARAADSAQTPTFSTAEGAITDWASIENAAQNWAALFRTFLDENFAH